MNHQLVRNGILALALTLGSAAAFAAPPADSPPGNGRGGGRGQVMAELGLTKEQQQKLKDHREAHQVQAKEMRRIFGEKREALRRELENPNFNESAAKKLTEELKVAHNRMTDHRLAGILEVRKILTPEQYAKFVQLRQERMKNRGSGQGMGRGGQTGQGPGGPGGRGGAGGPTE